MFSLWLSAVGNRYRLLIPHWLMLSQLILIVTLIATCVLLNRANAAASPTIVIPGNKTGILGSSERISFAAGPAPLMGSSTYVREHGIAAITQSTTGCTTTTEAIKGSSGVYGFPILDSNGNNTRSVILPSSLTIWQRTIAEGGTYPAGRTISLVTFHKGTWKITAIFNQTLDKFESDPDGTSGITPRHIYCPNLFPAIWDATQPNAFLYDPAFRFFVDATNLAPGRYYTKPIYLGSFSANSSGNNVVMIVDRINIVATNFSCTLSAPGSVELSNFNPTATILTTTHCQDDGNSLQGITVQLSMEAAGASSGISDNTRLLGVSESDKKLTIAGSWSTLAPPCGTTGSDDILFDGTPRELGTLAPGRQQTWQQPLSFRLCVEPNVAQRDYQAHALLSVVTR
ncbi:hypothetical protein [Serratia microhaemolytica]|uniref:hypothetical protein n=1 Tax=Serratia microhaemolytica TaxID=2675110 RepID=UPI001981EC63|nr:hypothetical protein [Serratia microhaemolytica]